MTSGESVVLIFVNLLRQAPSVEANFGKVRFVAFSSFLPLYVNLLGNSSISIDRNFTMPKSNEDRFGKHLDTSKRCNEINVELVTYSSDECIFINM